MEKMPSSAADFDRAILMVRVFNIFTRIAAAVYNWTVAMLPGIDAVTPKTRAVPLNGWFVHPWVCIRFATGQTLVLRTDLSGLYCI